MTATLHKQIDHRMVTLAADQLAREMVVLY